MGRWDTVYPRVSVLASTLAAWWTGARHDIHARLVEGQWTQRDRRNFRSKGQLHSDKMRFGLARRTEESSLADPWVRGNGTGNRRRCDRTSAPPRYPRPLAPPRFVNLPPPQKVRLGNNDSPNAALLGKSWNRWCQNAKARGGSSRGGYGSWAAAHLAGEGLQDRGEPVGDGEGLLIPARHLGQLAAGFGTAAKSTK